MWGLSRFIFKKILLKDDLIYYINDKSVQTLFSYATFE